MLFALITLGVFTITATWGICQLASLLRDIRRTLRLHEDSIASAHLRIAELPSASDSLYIAILASKKYARDEVNEALPAISAAAGAELQAFDAELHELSKQIDALAANRRTFDGVINVHPDFCSKGGDGSK